MAKFKGGDLDLKTGQKIDFNDANDVHLGYVDGDMYVNNTVSGVWGVEGHHLIILDQLTQASGSLSSQIPDTLIDLADTPAVYGDGKFLKSTASGTEWATITTSGGADLSALQIRRTTDQILTSSWVDVTFDKTDFENNTSVLEHDNTNTDRVLIKEDGTYAITYNFTVYVATASDVVESFSRLRKNDTTVISGSEAEAYPWYDSTDQIAVSVVTSLSANDFVSLQISKETIADTSTAIDDITMTVIRLEGAEGAQGEDGPQGEKGDTGFGLWASARVDGDGTVRDSHNMNVSKSATGTYDCAFDTNPPDAYYQVIAQPYQTVTDTNTMVSNVTVSGFTLKVGQGDNGSSPDTLLDTDFSVIVFDSAGSTATSGTIDHGGLLGLGDDDHTQYTLVNGSRGFTSTVSGISPTNDNHLTTRQYVDDAITTATGSLTSDHGDLTGLGDDDHTQYILEDGTRGFTGTVSGIYPTQDKHLTTKEYVDTVSGSISGHSHYINDLDDVNANNPLQDQVLTYSGTEWVPTTQVSFTGGSMGEWEYAQVSGDTDPGNKKFKVDNSDQTLITEIYLSDTNRAGVDLGNFLGEFDPGDRLYLQKTTTADQAYLYEVVSVTDNTSYHTFSVTYKDDTGIAFNKKDKITFVKLAKKINVITDHGLLTGLSDDDHPQYTLADGTRAFIGTVSGIDPTEDEHLTTRFYVDTISGSLQDGIDDVYSTISGAVSDFATVQTRRSTNYTLPTSYTDIVFDTTDIESDPNVLEHNNTSTARIDIKKDGLYMLSFSVSIDADAGENQFDFRILKNGTTVVVGSERRISEDDEINDAGCVCYANLSDGDYVTFQAMTNGGTNVLIPQSVYTVMRAAGVPGDKGPKGDSGDLTVSGVGDTYFDAYDDAGGTTVAAAWTDVPLDTERIKSSAFSHASSSAEVTINKTGTYIVTARVSTTINTGTGRTDSSMQIVKDTGTGYATVAGTTAVMYNRTSNLGENTGTVTAILELNADDSLKVQAKRDNGSSTLNLLPGGSSLTIFSTIGKTGEDGADGAPGAGSSVTLKKEGTTVSGNPFSILNFTGSSVRKVEAESGTQAEVYIEPIFGSWYGWSISDSQSSTNSTSWQTKTTYTSPTLPAGYYRIGYTFEWRRNTASNDFEGRVLLDGTTTIMEINVESKDVNSWHLVGGYDIVSLTNATHTIVIQYAGETTGNTSYIRRARIEFWRIS